MTKSLKKPTETAAAGLPDEVRAPRDLVAYLATLPYLGRTTLSHREVAAGSREELILTHQVGAAGFADSGVFKATFRFYSDWELFQTDRPAADGHLAVDYEPRPPFPGESPATVQRLLVRFDPKGHERPYQKAVIVDVVDGYLKPGDQIVIRLGDRRHGGGGTRVQTFAEDSFRIRCYADTAGTSRFAALPDDLELRIRPGPPAALAVVTPRWVRTGQPFPVRIRLEDRWGNVAACPETIAWELSRGGLAVDHGTASARQGWVALEQAIAEPGRHELAAALAGQPAIRGTAPITVDVGDGPPRAFFADLHVHSHDTVGTNSTEANLAYGRDPGGLDVLGYTVNDFQVTGAAWREAVALCHRFHQEGSYVVYPGTEWCGASAAGGDHNLVFLGDEVRFPNDAAGRSLRSFEWREAFQGSRPEPGRWPITDWYAAYADAPEKFLVIPHVGGRRAIFDWHHPNLERLVEISSSWGHFDWFYRDALARGLRVGASAAGDEHRGRPGGGAPGVSTFGVRGGLTGILADHLGRVEIGRALRARHTWATTGERNVALLWTEGARQGDEVPARGEAVLHYRLLGHRGWEYAALCDHRGVLWERPLDLEGGYAPNRVRIRWGGARVRDRYRWAEWRGRITIAGARIQSWQPWGLEHPAETMRREDGQFLFSTETYGDTDGIDLDLDALRADARIELAVSVRGFRRTGNAADENPAAGLADVTLMVTGSELLDRGFIRRDLGGEGLQIAVERLTGAPLPLELEGTVAVQTVRSDFGFHPVYLYARERGDAKVWTSPLFLQAPALSGLPI